LNGFIAEHDLAFLVAN